MKYETYREDALSQPRKEYSPEEFVENLDLVDESLERVLKNPNHSLEAGNDWIFRNFGRRFKYNSIIPEGMGRISVDEAKNSFESYPFVCGMQGKMNFFERIKARRKCRYLPHGQALLNSFTSDFVPSIGYRRVVLLRDPSYAVDTDVRVDYLFGKHKSKDISAGICAGIIANPRVLMGVQYFILDSKLVDRDGNEFFIQTSEGFSMCRGRTDEISYTSEEKCPSEELFNSGKTLATSYFESIDPKKTHRSFGLKERLNDRFANKTNGLEVW